MKELLKDLYRTMNPYLKFREKCEIEEKTVLYEAFFGRSMSCSPYAMFKALLADKAFVEFKHVWVLDDFSDNKEAMREYEQNGQVVFVKYKSREYYRYLASAKYLINNSTFPECFIKREEQVYINTWHGIPLKTMGYDMVDGAIGSANTVRNYLQADYLISPNAIQSRMYLKSYQLDGIFQGKVIETGQPRCDAFFEDQKEYVFQRLQKMGVKVEKNKKIILYAPTWKGSNFSKPFVDVQEYLAIRNFILGRIDTEKYQVLIKPHQTVYKEMKKKNIKSDCMIGATIDTNELLSVVDILISDYSSIFFDFLVTKRPVLFYIPDLREYEKERGIYQKVEELPGPATDKLEKLCDMIMDIEQVKKEWTSRYEQVYENACLYEDGNVSKRIINYIFKQEKQECTKGRIYQNESKKKKLLFFLGALRNHGITFSMLGLLKHLDYQKYDVTLYIYKPNGKEELQRMRSIPKQVRILVHTKSALGNPYETLQFAKKYTREAVEKVGKREYQRMFGSTRFDYVVDFVGYSPLFSAVASQAQAEVKSIWQHNDMMADMKREVKGKYVNKDRLEKVFQTYNEFDRIVSCSKSVMKVNQKNFGTQYAKPSYRYARNMIDLDRIWNGVREKEGQQITVQDLVTDQKIVLDEQQFLFVTMGRLSTEKNQKELIRAFAGLQTKEKKAKLFILGDGPLREELKKEIIDLKLEGQVVLCGNERNPFAIMKRCQCFVLPSLHEGQPMVILEARVLQLQLIVSDFSTVEDVLSDNGQIVTQKDAASIRDAMQKAYDGKLLSAKFDGEAYNQEALEEFYQAIEK